MTDLTLYVKWDKLGDAILHDASGSLRCNLCKKPCGETYTGGFCAECKDTMMAGKKDKGLTKMLGLGPTLVRKEGDIWKLPKASSPMWTEQWGYQGSSKTPYIVSHNSQRANGATTEDGWACSCPNFTRNTPRTKCKHILNVMLKEGLGAPGATKLAAKLANIDAQTAAEFDAWQREKAAAKKQGPAKGAKLNLFGATGRKFR